MTINTNGEQLTAPATLPAENTNQLESLDTVDSGATSSSMGKFKNAESLHSAYLDLEKEFTKKSQRLSELEKKQEQDNVEKSTPYYLKENWREEIKSFLSTHNNALDYASEISDELMKDNNLACLPNSLELAYSKVLARKYKSADEMINDKEFIEQKILKNEQVKNQIIKDYLKNVGLKDTPPVVLSTKGSTVGFGVQDKPKSLNEAKKMVEKLFF